MKTKKIFCCTLIILFSFLLFGCSNTEYSDSFRFVDFDFDSTHTCAWGYKNLTGYVKTKKLNVKAGSILTCKIETKAGLINVSVQNLKTNSFIMKQEGSLNIEWREYKIVTTGSIYISVNCKRHTGSFFILIHKLK